VLDRFDSSNSLEPFLLEIFFVSVVFVSLVMPPAMVDVGLP
jgi:hypothetical protein